MKNKLEAEECSRLRHQTGMDDLFLYGWISISKSKKWLFDFYNIQSICSVINSQLFAVYALTFLPLAASSLPTYPVPPPIWEIPSIVYRA